MRQETQHDWILLPCVTPPQVYLHPCCTENEHSYIFDCEEMIQNPSTTWTKHLRVQQLYWAILLTEFWQSSTLFHSHSNIWRHSPATKITPVRRHNKRNSNIWNSRQFISEAQCYVVYILVPGGRFTLGGRTFVIYCTGNPVGSTDLLEMTKTNSQGQPENKFSIHSLKFEFRTVIATTWSLYHVVGTAFTLPVERSPSSVLSAIMLQLFIPRD
jgi:hypothetical protein